jgi:hypothetical protein
MISNIVDRNMKSGFGSGGCVLSCVVLILLTGRVPVRVRYDPSVPITFCITKSSSWHVARLKFLSSLSANSYSVFSVSNLRIKLLSSNSDGLISCQVNEQNI